jgi:DNA-binding transcriptional regulator YdaS (Cro superfamily)
VEFPKQQYGNGGTEKVKAEHVLKIVAASDGEVAAHQIRPDLPDLFPDPERSTREA